VAVVGITGHLDREATARVQTASSALKTGMAKHYTGVGQPNIR
jgi:hypothetical protein